MAKLRIDFVEDMHETPSWWTEYHRARFEQEARKYREIAECLENQMSEHESLFDWYQTYIEDISVKSEKPPGRATLLLDFLLPHSDRESLIGDLQEEYHTRILPKYGSKMANRWYWWQTIRSLAHITWGRVRIWVGIAVFAKAVGWLVQKFGL